MKVITNLPTEYTEITRKQNQFTPQDEEQKQTTCTYVLNSMPSTLPELAAFRNFPPFLGYMCHPDGSNYYLTVASLGSF
jgi:hypothetical protein